MNNSRDRRVPGSPWRASLSVCLLVLAIGQMHGSVARAAEARLIRDLEYARVEGIYLKLDLHLPAGEVRAPLIAWVHGGAWRAGSKEGMPLAALVERGYAVASIDYPLSTVARFPAQIFDLKAAIRFLRARGQTYGVNGKTIVVAGDSAGGHLAALVGVSSGVPALEGTEGDELGASSAVQGIMSFYGASDLETILAESTPQGRAMREPALRLLLGGLPSESPELARLARLASPVAHVNASAPPLLLVHGEADPQMPPEQAHELAAAYQKAGRPVVLEMIPGAKHGGEVFYDATRRALMEKLLQEAVGQN